jgi:hypothetical protein
VLYLYATKIAYNLKMDVYFHTRNILQHNTFSVTCFITYIPAVMKGSPASQQKSLLLWMMYSYNLHHMRHMMLSAQQTLHSAHCDVNCSLNWTQMLY